MCHPLASRVQGLTPAAGAGVLKHGLSDREEGLQGAQCNPLVTALEWERRGGRLMSELERRSVEPIPECVLGICFVYSSDEG